MSAPIASVSSEGGAFLIADAVAVRSWRGIDDPDHYDGLCAYLDADEGQVLGKFVRGNDSFATWEPGAGTALIYQRGQSFALIHGAHSNVADPFIQGAHDVPVRTLTIRIESQVI